VIKTGNGSDVVILGNNAETVKVRFIPDGQTAKQGTKTLVVKGLAPNDLGVAQSGTQLTLTAAGNTLAILDTSPDAIFFKGVTQSVLIDDVGAYVTARKVGAAYAFRRAYSPDRKQTLLMQDLTRDQVKLHIAIKSYGMDIQLKAGSQALYGFSVSMVTSAVLNAVSVAHAFQLQLKGGMVFQNETLDAPRVRAFIMDKLRSSSGYTVVGSTGFAHVIDMSQVASPCTVPTGDALILANKEGSTVQGGTGNNVINVMASNLTVGTGNPDDQDPNGHSIVQIQADVQNVTVKLIAPGYSYKIGPKYLIMDGVDAMGLSFTNLNGTPLGYYMGASDPFLMKYAGQTIARFDAAPSCFLFRRGDEYELVDSALYYIQQRNVGQWIQRLLINRERLVTVKAEDVDSTALKLSVSWSSSWITFVLKTDTVFNLFQIDRGGDSRTTVKSGDVAQMIACKMPGGIRFRDRSCVGDALVQLLMSKLTTAAITGVTIQAGAPTQTLAQVVAADTTYSKYLAALTRTQQAITVTNLDAAGVLVGV
jgi:hypothetical protein